MMSFKILLALLFGLLVSGICFLGIVSYEYYEVSVATAGSVNYTYEVIDKTRQISSTCKDLQLESNVVLASGDWGLMQRYRAARNGIISQINDLRALTSDNEAQQMKIDSLYRLVRSLAFLTDSALIVPVSGAFSPDRLKERVRINAVYRSQVEGLIFRINDEERRLLLAQQKIYTQSNVAFRNRFIQLIGGIAILLVTTFLSIRYNFNRRIEAEIALNRTQDDLKVALESEIELSKMKSNFVTLASHEFRTPLTTILSSTFLLEKYAIAGDKGKVDRHLSRIRSSVTNITSMLDDFLSITKIEERQVVPQLERVNVKKCVESVCQNLGALVKPGQAIVYTHTGEESVVTDPLLLGNIVTNLVSNAIKYSPEHSSIVVRSSFDGSLHLVVRDNGIGIPIEDQKHLFERFYRASNAGAVQGTGLGLNILKHYVDMLHGEIKVHSEPGKGTEFEIWFDPSNNFAEDSARTE